MKPAIPVRLQLSRAKGFNLQSKSLAVNELSAVKVDRTTKWGNPFPVGKDLNGRELTAKDSVRTFQRFLKMSQTKIMNACQDGAGQPNPIGGLAMIIRRQIIVKNIQELRGKNLACWCKLPKPGEPDICHAAVLLRLANQERKEGGNG